MFRFILKRLGYTLVTLWVIITLTFVAMHSVPGNPFNSERMTPTVLANLNARYGLNRPLHEQYFMYWKNLLKGDLGTSMRNQNRTVNELIGRTFPISLKLGVLGIAWSVPLGILVGVLAALRRNKWQDRVSMITSMILVSLPAFVFATLVQLLFGVAWQKWTGSPLFPVGGWGEPKYMILPVLSMGVGTVATYARMMRSSMLDVMGQDYIKTARSKGLSHMEVIWRHALRNAMLPIVTMLGMTIAFTITGSLVLEQIFGIPGLGRYFALAVQNSDYTMILGTTVFWAVIVIGSLFVVDLCYGLVDPRIRLQQGKAA